MKKEKNNKSNKGTRSIIGRGNTKPIFLSFDEFFYSEKLKEDLRNAEILKQSSK